MAEGFDDRAFSRALQAANEGVWLSSERCPPLPLPPLDVSATTMLQGIQDEDVEEFVKALPPRWIAEERAFLELVRAECSHSLDNAPQFQDAYGERRLIRFLRHYKTTDKALDAVVRYLRWRRENEVDAIRLKIEQGLTDPRAWPYGDTLLSRCCVLPCSIELFDVKGNALCIEQYGHWPASRLRDLKIEGYVQWHTHCLEMKMILLERIALARERVVLRAAFARYCMRKEAGKVDRLLCEGWGEIARLCTIFDQSGMTFSHALLPCGLRLSKVLVDMVQSFYPWLQDTTHLTNAPPAIVYVMQMMKPVLPKRTQEKIRIHGVDTYANLHLCIRPDFLPTALGGRAVCAEMEPPPGPDELKEMTGSGQKFLRTYELSHRSPNGSRRQMSLGGARELPVTPRNSQKIIKKQQLEKQESLKEEEEVQLTLPPVVEAPRSAVNAITTPEVEQEKPACTSETCRKFLAALLSGDDVATVKHGSRGVRSDRRLKFRRGVLILSPQNKTPKSRFSMSGRRTRVMALDGGAFVVRPGMMMTAPVKKAKKYERGLIAAWQQAALSRAQAFPPNFAVIAIPRKMLTLELPSEEIAGALIDFINKSPFTSAARGHLDSQRKTNGNGPPMVVSLFSEKQLSP